MSFFELIIVQPIFNALMALYALVPGGEFGISVILFTILVRWAMWPLVKKQLHQVKAMRKMQPELAKIKKKAKGDRQVEGMMMMELYKRHNVNPFRSIGLLLIQLPIFIGLYQVIKIFTDRRDELAHFTYWFLEKWEPVKNLIDNPDIFNQHLFGVIDLTKHAISASAGEYSPFLIVLAIGAGFLQYVSIKQTSPQQETKGEKKGLRQIMAEAADGKQADQSEINTAVMGKMMKVMPIMMIGIMLTLPGAIALYYAVSTAVAVLQQHVLLRRDEEELEAMADKQVAKEKKQRAKARVEKAKTAEVVADVPSKKPVVKSSKTTKKSGAKTATKATKSKSSKSKKTTSSATVRVVAKSTKKGRK